MDKPQIRIIIRPSKVFGFLLAFLRLVCIDTSNVSFTDFNLKIKINTFLHILIFKLKSVNDKCTEGKKSAKHFLR